MRSHIHRLASLAAAGMALCGAAHADTILYFNDFQASKGGEWSSTSSFEWGLQGAPLPVGHSRKFLGYFGGNDVTTLSITGVPAAATRLRLEFDAYLMWSWDGNDARAVDGVARGPDTFGFRYGAGGTPSTESAWTFSHGHADLSKQTYCDTLASPCLPTTGAVERYTLGYKFEILPTEEDMSSTKAAPMDTVYHFVHEFEHTGSTASFSFFSRGLQVRPDLSFPYLDEAWGLDNVRVVANVPEPGSVVLLGVGLLALMGSRMRRRTA